MKDAISVLTRSISHLNFIDKDLNPALDVLLISLIGNEQIWATDERDDLSANAPGIYVPPGTRCPLALPQRR